MNRIRAQLVTEEMSSRDDRVLQKPLHYPDLPPCEFFFFQKLKSVLKGYRNKFMKDIVCVVYSLRLYVFIILSDVERIQIKSWQSHDQFAFLLDLSEFLL